jgi:hypothetical protein
MQPPKPTSTPQQARGRRHTCSTATKKMNYDDIWMTFGDIVRNVQTIVHPTFNVKFPKQTIIVDDILILFDDNIMV